MTERSYHTEFFQNLKKTYQPQTFERQSVYTVYLACTFTFSELRGLHILNYAWCTTLFLTATIRNNCKLFMKLLWNATSIISI